MDRATAAALCELEEGLKDVVGTLADACMAMGRHDAAIAYRSTLAVIQTRHDAVLSKARGRVSDG